MRYTVLGLFAWLLMGAAAGAQAPEAQLMAPVQKFVDAFNKGDVASAAATHLADEGLVIIDEAPPYFWRGPQAVQTWAADLAGHDKKRGVTDQSVTLGKVTRSESEGDSAYLVVPAVYTFKEGGKAMTAAAQMTFALKKGTGGWLIHGWTWTGPKPVPAAAKP